MGTDIHGRVQTRWNENGKWMDAGEIERERRYLVFAILAGVRNGHGFAGVSTHKSLQPISLPRGLPDDAEYTTKVWLNGDLQADAECDYGDHSQTWLTLSEILEWPHWNDPLQRIGVVDRAEWLRAKSENDTPNSWCGGISGRDVVVVDEAHAVDSNPNWTHVQATWVESPISKLCSPYWEWFQYLKAKHGEKNVRLVIGFDS